ncbi:uncharacterized protein EI97DRAFT_477214 [Westerdykella ornata]|uniref:Uncharacterized protein n=1 Tax=Westerdykella ornata TaxID=318751 RepID=A0A6A6JEI7_WESOR|nr:uncharacterized protein EI97DRAFT_477214 [Westerdykella ornata]KAF2274583.1 hypothetical protein EI97DRAFT_477214 [Westerdykella ornata]
MYLNFANSLASLLAFSQALWAVQAFPKQHDDLPAHILPAHEGGSKSSDINIATTPWSKRDPPLIPNWSQGPGTTWSGYLREPQSSGWTEETIDNFAYWAWRQTRIGSRSEATLVAALWICGTGVYLGSIPHGQEWGTSGGRASVQALMDNRLRYEAPVMWSTTGGTHLDSRILAVEPQESGLLVHRCWEVWALDIGGGGFDTCVQL